MARDIARGQQTASMRAADTDRQQVADRLRAALDEGRLSLLEYDERVRRAYAAPTYAELLHLLSDLPQAGLKADDVRAQAEAEARRLARRLPTALLVLWTIWGAVSAVNIAIWMLVSLNVHYIYYLWPAWVIVPPGAALLAVTIGAQVIRAQNRP